MKPNIVIRKILPSDNTQLASIIRKVLIDFGGNRPGTAFYDYDTEHMFEAYQNEGQLYLVAEVDGIMAGGCGIKQLKSAQTEICELQKLYLDPKYRGMGIGKTLVEKCLEFAVISNYEKCYLETFPNMLAAIELYKKMGFTQLDSPIGNTGHNGCDVWMLKNFNQ